MSDTDTNHPTIDFAEVENLFIVVEKCVAHSGKYSSIMGLAMLRLGEIEDEAKAIREEYAKAQAEADQARRDAAEQAAAKEFDDAKAAEGGEAVTQADAGRRF